MFLFAKDGYHYISENDEKFKEKMKSYVPFLSDIVLVEKGFTLLDFFTLINKEMDLTDVIFAGALGGNPLKFFIDEVFLECPMESKYDFNSLCLAWSFEIVDIEKENILLSENLSGYSDICKKEIKKEEIFKNNAVINMWGSFFANGKDGDYGLDFIPLYRLKNVPIEINDLLVISDNYKQESDREVISGRKYFTVYEFITAILAEISIYGVPKERDYKFEQIMDDLDKEK